MTNCEIPKIYFVSIQRPMPVVDVIAYLSMINVKASNMVTISNDELVDGDGNRCTNQYVVAVTTKIDLLDVFKDCQFVDCYQLYQHDEALHTVFMSDCDFKADSVVNRQTSQSVHFHDGSQLDQIINFMISQHYTEELKCS